MILNCADILNKFLGELGINNAVLVLQPTTVGPQDFKMLTQIEYTFQNRTGKRKGVDMASQA